MAYSLAKLRTLPQLERVWGVWDFRVLGFKIFLGFKVWDFGVQVLGFGILGFAGFGILGFGISGCRLWVF